jgi:hypothetical protein
MLTKTGIALATMFVIGASSHAIAQSVAPNVDAPPAVSQDIVAPAPRLTPVASHQSPRSTHPRLRQSRNAGLNADGYAPWSGSQAPGSGNVSHGFPENNYQYWRQACCQ